MKNFPASDVRKNDLSTLKLLSRFLLENHKAWTQVAAILAEQNTSTCKKIVQACVFNGIFLGFFSKLNFAHTVFRQR